MFILKLFMKMGKVEYRSGVMFLLLLTVLFVLSSCSDDSYLNVIPENSKALVSVDVHKLLEQSGRGDDNVAELKSLFKVDDINDCGIDFSHKIYLFETVEGNIGAVAKVSDEDYLDDWLNKLAKSGLCGKTAKRKDYRFTVIKDSWVVGFSSDAFVAMGPVLPAQYAEIQQQIVKALGQKEEQGIKGTPILDKLDSINSAVAVVAQAAALPGKFIAPFTLCAPKDADASQIMISAEINTASEGCLEIKGETFSFNKNIDSGIKENLKIFRPINGKYIESMSSAAIAGAFMNVDGGQFIRLLHSNNAFQALLAGMNMAIDIDNIIKSVDGEMAVVMLPSDENGVALQMGAQLGNKDFLKDIGYWKQSCPAGSRITDWGKDSYYYTDGKVYYYFGVSDDMQYYSGNTPDNARRAISKSLKPIPEAVRKKITGQRLCMVLNVDALLGGNGQLGTAADIITPLFGNVRTVLYSIKVNE